MSAYSIKIADNAGVTELTCTGNLIINHIEKIYGELQESLSTDNSVSVVIDDPENLDITFVQLVMAIKKSVTEKGHTFSIKTKLKDDLKQLVLKAGLEKEINI